MLCVRELIFYYVVYTVNTSTKISGLPVGNSFAFKTCGKKTKVLS